jgi:Protein of unknown function (DUF4089)
MARNIRRSRNNARPAKPAARRRVGKSAGRKASVSAQRRSGGDAAATRTKVIETLMEASAEALGLTIDPAWRASVKRNLHVILGHAALVDQFSLPDEIEPAPVFRA